jgi:hypothetical protein
MSAPAVAPPQNLVDGVDVDAVARAVRGCPGVEDLHGGFPSEVATYLPGRRVFGVRVGSRAVEVQVRTAWGVPVRQIAVGIQAAVAPLAGGRAVDVTIAGMGDPPSTGQTGADQPGTSGQAGTTAPDAAADLAEAADRLKVAGEPRAGGQAAARHGWPMAPGEMQSAPPLPDPAERPERMDRLEHPDRPAPPGLPARADPPNAEGSDRS